MFPSNNNMMNQYGQFNNQPILNPIYQVNQMNQMNQNQFQNSPLDPNLIQNMIKLCRENPNLLNQFNEEVKKGNNNFSEQSIFNNSNYLKMAQEGKVPRRIFSQIKKSDENMPINNNFDSDLINVCFELSSGQKFNEQAKKSMKILDLFIKFITRLGFKKDLIGKDICFLFNGGNVDSKQYNKTLREMGIENNAKILVLDIKGIIGAKFQNLKIKIIKIILNQLFLTESKLNNNN